MMDSTPSRMTLAWGADILFSASSAFSALDSCTTPITAFRMTIRTISRGSNSSPQFCSTQITTKEITAAAMRMRIMTSLN